ncbi:MAG: ferredoxin [Planctomycetes bacterium]|jgi:ferredoxin|nr:ferredoxin [Planctomycetota bacterium]
MTIKVNQDACVGCGLCANMCSDVFKINNDNKSEVISQDNMACAKQAAESCPVAAITVE